MEAGTHSPLKQGRIGQQWAVWCGFSVCREVIRDRFQHSIREKDQIGKQTESCWLLRSGSFYFLH